MNSVAVKETILDRAMRCRERGESMKGEINLWGHRGQWMQITESSTGGNSKCTRQEAGNAPQETWQPIWVGLGEVKWQEL